MVYHQDSCVTIPNLLSGPEGPEPALVSLVSTDGGLLCSPRRRRQSAVAKLHEVISIRGRRGYPLPERVEMRR